MDKLRDSGINVIGDISWGTHIGQLYLSTDDIFRTMIPYVQAGLRDNEMCLWVYSPNTCFEQIVSELSHVVNDLDAYLESGQLMIIPHTEWYLEGNSFNGGRANKKWNDMTRLALDKGYDGLRAVADTHWLDESLHRDFSHYEYEVNLFASELPLIVICLYDAGKIGKYQMADIIKNHCYVITRHRGLLELIENVELMIKSRQLEESKKRYKNLIQLLPVSVFIHDNKQIYYCNQAAISLMGIKKEQELYGTSMAELICHDKRAEFTEFVEKALAGAGDTNYLQTKIICGSECKDVEITAVEYEYGFSPTLLSVVRDLSPIRKINELTNRVTVQKQLLDNTLEYEKMRTEFFSNISHELRTPLNVILSVIQLLKLQSNQIGSGSGENKYVRMMQQNCYRLLRLVNNLIDITKIDADYFKIKPRNYNIVKLAEEITMSVVEYGLQKGITIHFDSNIEDKVIACDPDQMERILLNLLSNAIKFTPKGGCIRVNIRDASDRLYLSVKDTGIGVPADKQKIIFERFQQADNSLTKMSEGSGIGLSLVKSLVEMHGGKISLKSEPGKGSEFLIELPCKVLSETECSDDLGHNLAPHNYAEMINIEFSDIYS